MGATLITVKSTGATMREAYRNAVDEAIYEFGNDHYNGTISTTSDFIDVTRDFLNSGKSIGDYADDMYDKSRVNKWGSALGICIAKPTVNNNKIKTKVETTPQRGKRTWVTVYEVQLFDGTVIGSNEFQIDAINIGRKYTEEHKVSTYVHITKKLANSNTMVSKISYKATDKEKPGTYYFIALAAE
jgi:hypothetical protein